MKTTVLGHRVKNLPFEGHPDVLFPPIKGHKIAPEGYMTIEEFRTETKQSLTKILNEHGIC